MLRNSDRNYGLITILLHWLMALLIPGLFVLGVYMRTLDYYDPWYNAAPALHKAIGMLGAGLLLIRWIWRMMEVRVRLPQNYHAWEAFLARLVHLSFYVLIAAVSVTGYLMSTARGTPVEIFGLLEVPSLMEIDNQLVEWMGVAHKYMSYSIMLLLVLHVAGAIKHHLLDRDMTLKRIIFPGERK